MTGDACPTEDGPAEAVRKTRLILYLAGQASWFFSLGLQFVLFPWLVAIVLDAPASLVGIAQMSLLAPSLLFMMFGGAVADQSDCRRILIRVHLLSLIPILTLAAVLGAGAISYGALITYALFMGTLGAFIMPARDSVLNRLAGGAVQRTVMLATCVQFSAQLAGMLLASLAAYTGAAALLLAQAVAILIGAGASFMLPPFPPRGAPTPLSARASEIRDSLREVFGSAILRPVVALMFAIGLLFVGSFLVVIPLMVRDIYGGGAAEISMVNVAFWSGTIFITLLLLRLGHVHNQGRAMILAVSMGTCVLVLLSLPLGFGLFCAMCFIWGVGAGTTMSMSRGIVQIYSRPEHLARSLAIYQLGVVGGGPIGALTIGFLISSMGLAGVTLVPAAAMALFLVHLTTRTSFWTLGTGGAGGTGGASPHEADAAGER